jgi:maleamate amidohydrolase
MIDGLEVYSRQGFGQRLDFGARPALLLIDFTNAFADSTLFGGGNIEAAIERTVPLLDAARRVDIPIVFTTHAYAADGSDYGLLTEKNRGLKRLVAGTTVTAIVERLAPRAGELVLSKRHPSAFFGTDLAGWLASRWIDTAIICGCTTSGCVRATAVDALGYGLRPVVVRECVGDRALAPHEANLFDLEQKYADVLPVELVMRQLTNLHGRVSAAK